MVARVEKPYQMLIADDDAGFRSTLKDVFESRRSVQTLEAESGEEAIALAEQHRIDVVLLDMYMHRLTGIETLRILKSLHAELPCILITASYSDDLKRDAEEADAFSILAKPVRKTELVTTVSLAIVHAYFGNATDVPDPVI